MDDEPVGGAFCDLYEVHPTHLYHALNHEVYACPGLSQDGLDYLIEDARRECEHGLSASLCAGPGHYPG